MIKPTGQLRWRRSKRCASNHCVEVARVGEHYLIRDSKRPDGTPLRFTREEWETFVAGIRGGDFDFA